MNSVPEGVEAGVGESLNLTHQLPSGSVRDPVSIYKVGNKRRHPVLTSGRWGYGQIHATNRINFQKKTRMVNHYDRHPEHPLKQRPIL